MSAPFGSYTEQTWDGNARVHDDISGLSIDAAREIARAHSAMGYTARVMAERSDYCEIYFAGTVQRGTFGELGVVGC